MKKQSQALNYKDNELHFKGIPLKELVSKNKTPFYLYSEEEILNNYKQYTHASKENDIDSIICFALKANNNLHLLKSLAAEGCGADIVSSGELIRALEANIDPKKIVFSGVGKTRADIELGIEKDILSFNVESTQELELINTIAKEKNKAVDIAFRLNPKVQAITHKHISTGFKTHKFGMLKEDILLAVKDKSLWTNTNLIGLSVHIGSQLTNMDATKEAVQEICKLANTLNNNLKFIDLGGGLGVDYNPKKKEAPSISQYVTDLMNIVKKELDKKITIVFEPGRSISASCGYLVSRVIRSKKSEECNFLIVDGGMNDFVRPALYDAYHEIYPSTLSEKLITTDVVGPVCETADCFGHGRQLPELKVDDFILLAHAGAYGHTMSSSYNMRSRPAELIITTKQETLL